jgi:hypothetical protein
MDDRANRNVLRFLFLRLNGATEVNCRYQNGVYCK